MRVAPTTTDPIEIYVVPLAMMFPEGIEAIPNDVGPAGLSLEIKGQRVEVPVTSDVTCGRPDDQVEVVVPVAPSGSAEAGQPVATAADAADLGGEALPGDVTTEKTLSDMQVTRVVAGIAGETASRDGSESEQECAPVAERAV